ncbi:MAG: hypothetical protein E5X52_35140 [Mesorhizobium sp.]|nr:MAG: hypothetical protein E5X52_35140 [Mesorhizobium sp.]
MPKTARLLIGMVAGFKSERWPIFDRNGGRLHVGIRNVGQASVVFRADLMRTQIVNVPTVPFVQMYSCSICASNTEKS